MGRKARSKPEAAELNMTPMIDCVFQLLIFFIVTFKPPEVIGRLDIFRPAPDPNAKPKEQKLDDMIRITVHKHGVKGGPFMLNQRWMSLDKIEGNLSRLTAVNKKQTVLIQCAEASRHDDLVRILNVCAKLRLTELSVVTLPTGAKGAAPPG